MTRKKNGFWRFIFSLLPGAGEMYMGFMKMGISLMTLFFVVLVGSSYLRVDFLGVFAIVIWFYSFFHVHNLAGMPVEEFYTVEDEFLFHISDLNIKGEKLTKTKNKMLAIVLIVAGVYLSIRGLMSMFAGYLPEIIWNFMYDLVYDLPQLLVGVGIIVLGIYMIRGKKQELDRTEERTSEEKEVK